MRLFSSVCTLDTLPHDGIGLQTNFTREKHGPHTRHKLHPTPHTTHLMTGCSASARGTRATTPERDRRSSAYVPRFIFDYSLFFSVTVCGHRIGTWYLSAMKNQDGY